MKPSQRIHAIAEGLRLDIERRADPANYEVHRHEYANSCLLRAIVAYLDGRHEDETKLNSRRIAVWTALANIGQGCSAAQINPLLEQAGIERLVYDGDSFDEIRKAIIASAREAGLL